MFFENPRKDYYTHTSIIIIIENNSQCFEVFIFCFQTRREIADQEIIICNLRQELEDKEQPYQVAQTRHYSRSFRPGIDRCLDEPHFRYGNIVRVVLLVG